MGDVGVTKGEWQKSAPELVRGGRSQGLGKGWTWVEIVTNEE